jgi:hypothetical protein
MSRKVGSEGRQAPITLRTTFELRDRVEQAAKSAGRSIAQEVEHRLENSFEQRPAYTMTPEDALTLFTLLVGNDERNLAFSLQVGSTLNYVSQMSGKSWYSSQETRDEVRKLLIQDLVPRLIENPPEIGEHLRRTILNLWPFLTGERSLEGSRSARLLEVGRSYEQQELEAPAEASRQEAS